jgi:VanZ family protein
MRKLRFWFPFFGYSVIIFAVSSLPSDKVAFTWSIWDKLLHTIEYAPLGVCAAYAVRQSIGLSKVSLWIVAAGICFSYGLSDEFHQSFVPGREVSLGDATADLVGGALGAGLYLIYTSYFMKRNTHVST